jgi:hypothetical protein
LAGRHRRGHGVARPPLTSRARAQMWTAQLAHQGPHGLADRGRDEVELISLGRCRLIAGFDCLQIAGFEVSTEADGSRAQDSRRSRRRSSMAGCVGTQRPCYSLLPAIRILRIRRPCIYGWHRPPTGPGSGAHCNAGKRRPANQRFHLARTARCCISSSLLFGVRVASVNRRNVTRGRDDEDVNRPGSASSRTGSTPCASHCCCRFDSRCPGGSALRGFTSPPVLTPASAGPSAPATASAGAAGTGRGPSRQ